MFHRRRLDRVEERQLETMAILRTVEAGLIASDPRTSMAADAYNGLRKQVSAAAQERRRMLLQLIAMSDAIERGATVETLRELCGQWCAEAGLRKVDDPAAEPELFDLVEGEAPPRKAISPAWLDSTGDIVIQKGLAEGTAPEPEPEPEATVELAPESPAEPEAAEAPPEPAAEAPEAQSEPEIEEPEPKPDPAPEARNDDADQTAIEEQR